MANGLHVASPIHFMLHDLIAMDNFYYFYIDYPEIMASLAERMNSFFEKALDAVMACECETFLWGGNYDQSTTYPAFFSKELVPWLRKAGKRAAAGGKYSISHTDGENLDLLPLYPDAGFQIAESVCSAPMTKTTLKEFRKDFRSFYATEAIFAKSFFKSRRMAFRPCRREQKRAIVRNWSSGPKNR